MKYSIEKIIKNKQNDFLFFWRHQPTKDGTITKTCFSQWWISSFKVDEIEYKSAEHFMMVKKAELFNDFEVMNKIVNANSPAEVKKLGREVRNYNDSTWLENRYKIVKIGNFHKFSQNSDLKKVLLSTEEKVLVEASPVDSIWGIGMASDNKNSNNPEEWNGLNLLGFALMEVRDELKQL